MTSKVKLTAPARINTLKSRATIAGQSKLSNDLRDSYAYMVSAMKAQTKMEMPVAAVIQDMGAILRMAGRRYLPPEAIVESEFDAQRGRTRVRIRLPFKATRPGERDENLEVSHELAENWFDPGATPMQVSEIASKIMQTAAEQFQEHINRNRRPHEDALALLAMTRLDARYEARSGVWKVFPLDKDPPTAPWAEGVSIDEDASIDEWRHLITSIIDLRRLRAQHPNLTMGLARDYAPESKKRDVQRKMQAMNQGMSMPDRYAQDIARRQYEATQRHMALMGNSQVMMDDPRPLGVQKV